jgi:hypothetical protein
MSSGWLPEHRQLFFQIFEEGPNFALSQLFEFPGKRALKIALAERDLTIRRIALEGFRFQLSTECAMHFLIYSSGEKLLGCAMNRSNL